MKNILHIDGSQGEAGGQVLRTSLSLSMITGTPVCIEKIRAGRAKPGLMRQHLACVKAAQVITDAEVSGAEVGSTRIVFKPKAIKAGDYHFAVGTAGSTLLIFQTVFPALALADNESHVTFEGGTHNMLAPSFDFVALAYLPVLQQMGFEVSMQLKRYGFYPQGGGHWQATIKPVADIRALELLQTGDLLDQEAVATSANIPAHVAVRELAEIAKQCQWPSAALKSQQVDCRGNGNILSIRLYHENCVEVVESVGKIGVSAEKIARQAIKMIHRYQATAAPVGEHLADQLLLPMAIGAGGVFRTLKPSSHTLTNMAVIQHFMNRPFKQTEIAKDCWEIQQG